MHWLKLSLLPLSLMAILAAGLYALAQNGQTKPARPADLKVDGRVTGAINDLGFRLFAEMSRADGDKNIFISPASIELALAMTYNGAGGTTKTAMAKAMGLGALTLDDVNKGNAQLLSLLKSPDPKVELAIANSLWGRQGLTFKQDFLRRVGTSYQAKLTTLNFAKPQAADTINTWVSDNTRGKIPTLVDPPMLEDAVLVLVNAIYFKGAWTTPFDTKQTQDGPFTLANGTKKTMPMMRQRDSLRYLETESFQAVSLPYGEGNVVMDVILPKPGVTPAAFHGSLTAANWNRWARQFRSREGMIVMPRYKAQFETSLKPALTALGMGIAFTDNASFPGLLEGVQKRLLISDAIHKTVLEVNEEGTVAAGVTGVVVGVTSMPMDPPFEMVVDRPFFVTIRDNPTGVLLFMGMINNPE